MKRNPVNAIERGEIFTPLPIVNEILDKIPSYVWRQSQYKWLEPSSGKGVFLEEIYKRLRVYHNEEHILTNMLYACEINEKNVNITKSKFNHLNIFVGDTLHMNWDFHFDVIVGNPPFNQGGIRSFNGKSHGTQNKTIWHKFVEKAFEWLSPNGILAFITPLTWLCKRNKHHLLFCEKHILWLKLLGGHTSNKVMDAFIPMSLFVLQNKINEDKKPTEIISQVKDTHESILYINPNHSLPLGYYSIFNQLKKFIEKHNCPLEVEVKLILNPIGDKIQLPSDYCLEDKWAIDTLTKKKGILVKKVETIHKDGDKRKLIIANKLGFYGAFIDEGKLSLCGKNKYYILGDNLELIQKMLTFKVMDILSCYTKYSQEFLHKDVFQYIPDLRKLGIIDINEDEFYKLVKINF